MSVTAFTVCAFLIALAGLALWAAVRHRSEPATSTAQSDGPGTLGGAPRLTPDALLQSATVRPGEIGQTRPPGAERDLGTRHGTRHRAPAQRMSPATGPRTHREPQSDSRYRRPRRPLGRGRHGEDGTHD